MTGVQTCALPIYTTSVDLLGNITTAKMPGLLADIVATGLDIPVHRKQYLLEILNPMERLEAVVAEMRQERAVLDIKKEIEGKTKQRIDQNQREYFLREEMKVLQEELGDKDGVGADAADFRKRLEEKNPPEQVWNTIEREISRMMKIPVTSPESNVSRNYIDTLLNLPWQERSEEIFDLERAAKILDKDH